MKKYPHLPPPPDYRKKKEVGTICYDCGRNCEGTIYPYSPNKIYAYCNYCKKRWIEDSKTHAPANNPRYKHSKNPLYRGESIDLGKALEVINVMRRQGLPIKMVTPEMAVMVANNIGVLITRKESEYVAHNYHIGTGKLLTANPKRRYICQY